MCDICYCKMDEYLTSTLNKLNSHNYAQLNLVLGNESCDLDSAVSSLVYATFLHWQYNQIKCKVCTRSNRNEDEYKDEIFIPVLNVDRDDYELKTEVTFCFREHGIDEGHLVFRDDLDIKQLINKCKTNVILVDHHVLAMNDTFLVPHVTEIIDHRPMDRSNWSYKEDVRTTVEIVGSCSTLVAQRIRDLGILVAKEVDFFNAYRVCSDMLHSTIILDTVNFSKEVNKATPHDEEIVLFLESLLKPNDYDVERKQKLDMLLAARTDVSGLNAAQLLKKDVKIIGDVFVPSFPILVRDYLDRPGALEAVSEALTSRGCSVALLLGMNLTDGLRRDLCIHSPKDNNKKAVELLRYLETWSSPSLHLSTEALSTARGGIYCVQNNLSASRKQYIQALNVMSTE